MKVLHLTPGTGNFHCGSCLRDQTLVKALRSLGHEALIAPLYLPHVLDDDGSGSSERVLFGGINAYLQQKLGLFRWLPKMFDSLLDFPPLLRWVSRFSGMTDPADLGEMTYSMLCGENGRQAKEIAEISKWTAQFPKPEIICLSNVLLAGLAPYLQSQLNVPVVCTLQGEDSFLDTLPDPWREKCWTKLKELCQQVPSFIAVSDYYGQVMKDRLELRDEQLHVVSNAIDFSDFKVQDSKTENQPILGYFARMCEQKGLHTIVDAFIELKRRNKVENLKLIVAGACTPEDEAFVEEQLDKLEAADLENSCRFLKNVSRKHKIEILHSFSVLSVPALYGESFGLYVLEALAAGVPFVQPDHAAFPEILNRTQGGLLYNPADSEDHILKLESLFLDPQQRKQLGRTGAENARAIYSSEVMAEQIAEIYKTTLKKFAGTAAV